MDDPVKSSDGKAETGESSASVAEFPSEPFPCPACGQMLAPTCRVCVACRTPIDFEAVGAQHPEVPPTVAPEPAHKPPPERVPYPWRLLVVVLSAGMLIGLASVALWGEDRGPIVVQGLPVLVGIWVFFDAIHRRIPRPLRWGIGTVLLLAVILPWYLARRSKPEATVPFVEAEAGPVTRFLLFALLIFFLISLVFRIVQGPQPHVQPAPAPKPQPTGENPRVTFRIDHLTSGSQSKLHSS